MQHQLSRTSRHGVRSVPLSDDRETGHKQQSDDKSQRQPAVPSKGEGATGEWHQQEEQS